MFATGLSSTELLGATRQSGSCNLGTLVDSRHAHVARCRMRQSLLLPLFKTHDVGDEEGSDCIRSGKPDSVPRISDMLSNQCVGCLCAWIANE